jgi:hypothetical protein
MTVGTVEPIMNALRPAAGSVCSFDDWRSTSHRDGLVERADFERRVECEELLGADGEPGALVGLVSLEHGLQRVGAGSEVREVVLTRLIGGGVAGDARRLVGERHFHAGDDAARVLYRTTNTALERLGERTRRRPKEQQRREQPE